MFGNLLDNQKDFLTNLKEFDQIWVPSKWQADCTIEQGS
jgi:uncharacterized protein YozE (UPF0346 family)